MSSPSDPGRRPLALPGEAARVARSQPVGSLLTLLIVATVCGVILTTTGRTVQAESQVLARIDEAGTRSITLVDTQGDARIHPDSIARIAALSGVEWVIGLGFATDITNQAIPGGTPTPLRTIHGHLPPIFDLDAGDWTTGTVVVGPLAQASLGLEHPVGGVDAATTAMAVVGRFTAGEPLEFLARTALTPPDPTDPDPRIRSVHILVTEPRNVGTIADAARSVLAADAPGAVSIETSEAFAQIRAAVAGELGRFGRDLVTLILAVGLVLVGLTVYGTITTRRRDFGRRRALGASRSDIVALVTLHTGLVATLGAVVGSAVGTWLVVTWTGAPPDWPFTTAVATIAILVALVAALPPALVAATRDPVRILRVP